MNRGSKARHEAEAARKAASMRPRFMNRGSLGSTLGRRGGGVASMRPRFMNRGSMAPMVTAAPRIVGFNEAPIHESGKSRYAIVYSDTDARLQ